MALATAAALTTGTAYAEGHDVDGTFGRLDHVFLIIMENQTEINKLLISYNIPILDETNMPITSETLAKRP